MTETARRLRRKTIDDALDPVFEVHLAEVDQPVSSNPGPLLVCTPKAAARMILES